jgi:thymidine kinase
MSLHLFIITYAFKTCKYLSTFTNKKIMQYKREHPQTRKKGSIVFERGSITLLTGAMFASKTQNLLSLVTKEKIMKRPYVLVKYLLDQRYSKGVSTHSLQVDEDCLAVTTCVEIESQVNLWDVDRIFIDEGQFFPDLYDFCCKWMIRGKHITIAALEFYADQTPWPQILKLSPLCQKIELHAICMICHGVATTCIEINPSFVDHKINIGGSDKYKSVCGACYLLESIQPIMCISCGNRICPNDFDKNESQVCEFCTQ